MTWLKATDVKGPWGPAGTLPASFSKLPADENWKDVKSSLPGRSLNASQAPKVFVSFEPAELILLRGQPNYLAVQGAKQLLWVNNTESDVFRMGRTGAVYFLVAGRWFSAPDFTGPWTFATPTLPDVFKHDPARARTFARTRVGAGHETGRRGRHARADSADRARQQDGAGARSRVSGRSARVPAD